MKKILAIIVAIVPINFLRIFLYNHVLGYKIDPNSHIGMFNLILCDSFKTGKIRIGNLNQIRCNNVIIGEGAWIRVLNKFILLNEVVIGNNSQVKHRNSIVGLCVSDFENRDNCNFYLGNNSLITIGHGIDCTDTVTIGDNVVLGGSGTQVWTHGFDYARKMIYKPILLQNDIYVGSRCMIVGGVTVCSKVSVAAATTVSKSIKEPGLYVSSQLIKK